MFGAVKNKILSALEGKPQRNVKKPNPVGGKNYGKSSAGSGSAKVGAAGSGGAAVKSKNYGSTSALRGSVNVVKKQKHGGGR
jgi:hypothetical protein